MIAYRAALLSSRLSVKFQVEAIYTPGHSRVDTPHHDSPKVFTLIDPIRHPEVSRPQAASPITFFGEILTQGVRHEISRDSDLTQGGGRNVRLSKDRQSSDQNHDRNRQRA
jgi:hypothetical protein